MDKRLVIFGFTYLVIMIILLNIMFNNHESVSLGYGIYIGIFLIIAAVALAILVLVGKINLKSAWNKIGLFFSTPIPYWILFKLWIALPMNETPSSTWGQNVNGKRIKEVHYTYFNHENKRIEYSTSVDTVTNEQPFPASEIYLLDSILYYNRNGELIKTEIYKNEEMIKSTEK